jgi:hypothetical protein
MSRGAGLERRRFIGWIRGTMCKTIKQRVKFKASPDTVYQLLADSRMHSTVTGKEATISSEIGGNSRPADTTSQE